MTVIVRRACAFSLALLLLAGGAIARAAESAALTLPDETIMAVRLPALSQFGDALRERTKLGKVVLSDERFAKLQALFEGQSDAEWKELLGHLERFSLKPEDLGTLVKGDLGAALLFTPNEDREKAPITMILLWAQPEQELADRLFAACEQLIEEDQQDEWPVKRVDLDLAGHPVIHVREAVVRTEEIDSGELPDFDDEKATEEYFERQRKLQAEAKKIQVGQVNIFLTRKDNRLLFGFTPPTNTSATRNPDDAPDFDKLSGLEAATNLFGKFLSLQDGGETGIVPKALAAPGVAASLPAGDVFLEGYVDSQALAALYETAPIPDIAAHLERFGLRGLGPMAYRATLDGNVLRATFMVSAPQPHNGLLTLIDQEAQPSEPADWVPASVMGYGHVSFDLVQLYDLIKQIALDFGGDQARESFDSLDRQTNGLFQADFSAILASLGKRHTVISLIPTLEEQAQPSDEEVFTIQKSPSRVAFVWQLGDEELWKRILKLGAAFSSQTQGMVEPAEEQGFTGLRLKTPAFDGGVFVGRNYLVIGLGNNVVETVLATLRTPPAFEESLRGSPIMARARELMPLEPGIMFQVGDQNRSVEVQRKAVLQNLDAQIRVLGQLGGDDDSTREAKEFIETLKGVIPSEDELKDILGVSVGHAAVSEQGVTFSTATEAPAP